MSVAKRLSVVQENEDLEDVLEKVISSVMDLAKNTAIEVECLFICEAWWTFNASMSCTLPGLCMMFVPILVPWSYSSHVCGKLICDYITYNTCAFLHDSPPL